MNGQTIELYVGYDSRLPVASTVLVHSAIRHCSSVVRTTLLNLKNLGGLYTRDVSELQSTEFSFSRFLVPCLSNYQGWSLFVDNDMIVLDDLAKLWALRDDRFAVMCVKHEHKPVTETKFMGSKQTSYEKKNWSSVMLFNNAKCRALTPEYVNAASGLQLHQFKWLNDDGLVGDLPETWNVLVDYFHPENQHQLLHFTEGGPYFPDYLDTSYADKWFTELTLANECKESSAFELICSAEKVLGGASLKVVEG